MVRSQSNSVTGFDYTENFHSVPINSKIENVLYFGKVSGTLFIHFVAKSRILISYPHSSIVFNNSMVKNALEMVGLGHFVDDSDKSARWEMILSQGERQMISFARIVLQKPSLVFLDEASSALTNEKERQMYELLVKLKIPFVSISHRPENLKQFHDRILNFHRDGLSYWQQWEE